MDASSIWGMQFIATHFPYTVSREGRTLSGCVGGRGGRGRLTERWPLGELVGERTGLRVCLGRILDPMGSSEKQLQETICGLVFPSLPLRGSFPHFSLSPVPVGDPQK